MIIKKLSIKKNNKKDKKQYINYLKRFQIIRASKIKKI